MLDHPNATRDDVAELVVVLRDIYNVKYAKGSRLDKWSRVYWFVVGFLGIVALAGIALFVNWLEPSHPISTALGW